MRPTSPSPAWRRRSSSSRVSRPWRSHELQEPDRGPARRTRGRPRHTPRTPIRPTACAAALTTVERLDTIVADLLAQARLDAAGGTAPHELIDLSRAPRPGGRPDEQGRRRHPGHGSTPRTDVWIFGSRIQLVRALANLVGNARRHAVSSVGLSLTTTGDEAVIAVTDDGPGIPPGRPSARLRAVHPPGGRPPPRRGRQRSRPGHHPRHRRPPRRHA